VRTSLLYFFFALDMHLSISRAMPAMLAQIDSLRDAGKSKCERNQRDAGSQIETNTFQFGPSGQRKRKCLIKKKSFTPS
jgi:hypothetical protein